MVHKKNLRVLKLSKNMLSQKNQTSSKSIMGGLLIQDSDDNKDSKENWTSVTKNNPTDEQALDLDFAWKMPILALYRLLVSLRSGISLLVNFSNINQLMLWRDIII